MDEELLAEYLEDLAVLRDRRRGRCTAAWCWRWPTAHRFGAGCPGRGWEVA